MTDRAPYTQIFYQCTEEEEHQVTVEADEMPDSVVCQQCSEMGTIVEMDMIWWDEA